MVSKSRTKLKDVDGVLVVLVHRSISKVIILLLLLTPVPFDF